MLNKNYPTITYISWDGLVLAKNNEKFIIEDGETNMKYVYWLTENPTVLYPSNTWMDDTDTRYIIYINDNGNGVEVVQEEITLYYTDIKNEAGISGVIAGKFDELEGKYYTISQDVNELKEVIGSESVEGNTLIDRVNKIEKTAEGTLEIISEIQRDYAEEENIERIRNGLTDSLLAMVNQLALYNNTIIDASKDLEVTSEEKTEILKYKDELDIYTQYFIQYHNEAKQYITDDNQLEKFNEGRTNVTNSINSINSIINTAISDNQLSPTEMTIIINGIATVSNNINDMKNTLLDTSFLGSRGEVITNLLNINKTASSFNQTMIELVEEIDGETGLKQTVIKNSTAIEQTAKELNLKYMKYDKTTAQLTVGDSVIKLDASKVLLTGTLTWDNLDETAKQNLKGEDGSAEYIMLTGEQIFKYDRYGYPEYTEIMLKTQVSNIAKPTFVWYYKTGDTWTRLSNTLSYIIISHDDVMWQGEDSLVIKVEVGNGMYYDEMTIVKLYDGKNGTDGIDGSDGMDARYVRVTGEQVFKINENVTSPEYIILYGEKFGFTTSQDKWFYKNADGEWVDLNNTGSTSLFIRANSPAFIGNTACIKYEANTYCDMITLSKLYDGENGQSAFTVILSNENVSVPCDENGNYNLSDLSDAYTHIEVYEGLEPINFTVEKVDVGCVSHYNTSTKTIVIDKIDNIFARVDININVGSNTFAKTFTVTKSLQGKTGPDGTGIQIIGQLDSVDELPELGEPGDAYIINGLIYVWSITNNTWSDGVPFRGETGIPGKDGIDGRTTYVHIKYSNDKVTFTGNGGKDPGKWMGQYTDFIQEDSQNIGDYTWVKIMGDDGEHGIVANLTNDSHVIPCKADGTPLTNAYVGCESIITLSHNGTNVVDDVDFSYSKSNSITGVWSGANGKFVVQSLTGDTGYVDLSAMYNGVRYTKRFTVSKNFNGEDSYVVNLSNDSHTFTTDSNGNLLGNVVTSIEIYAYKGGQSITPTIGTLPIVTGLSLTKSNNIITITANKSMAENGTIDIPITVGDKNIVKKFSYSKVKCGKDGADGIDGTDGIDGYTIVLSNENEVFNCDYFGNIANDITVSIKVQAFRGTTSVTPTIGTLPTVTGMTISKSASLVTVVAKAGGSLASMGSFNIPVTIDGIVFNKTFKWCKVYNAKDQVDLPDWIADWDGRTTTINGTKVISPRIFAGTLDSSSKPTGVALGMNVFGTSGSYSNVNGIVGYRTGVKQYEFNTSGDILIGDLNGQYISWTSSGLKINANTITLNSQGLATSSQLTTTEGNIMSSVSKTYTTKEELTIQVEDEKGNLVKIPITDAHNQLMDTVDGYKKDTSAQVSGVESAVTDNIKNMLDTDYVTKNDFSILENTVTSSVEQTEKKIEYNFTETTKLINSVDGKITENESELKKYIRFGIDGIELGENTNQFKTKLDNKKLAFIDGTTEVAYISNKALNITDANIVNSLQIGYFRFLPRENGNLSFVWVDDVNVASIAQAEEKAEINRIIEEGDEE